MLIFKAGVRAFGLQPEILWALDQATDIFEAHGADCIVTSGRGDQHGAHSNHYKGHAADLRRRHVPGKESAITDALRAALGVEYQLILETTHWHVEYDPLHATEYLTKKAA